MSEGDIVAATEHPGTRDKLAPDLRRLGLARGDTVLVHSSLAALGWEEGSPLLVDGTRRWVRYRVPPLDDSAFPDAGRFLVARGIGRAGRVGAAPSHLLPMGEAVDAVAARWGASSGPGRADP